MKETYLKEIAIQLERIANLMSNSENISQESSDVIDIDLSLPESASGITYQDWFDILSHIDSEYTTAVETGTYTGDTTKFLANRFKKVHTVELDEGLYEAVSKGNSELQKKSVSFHLGDSAKVFKDHLIDTLNKDNEKVFFFLDAHWSGDDTVDWENSLWKGGYTWARGKNTAHRGLGDNPSSFEQVPLEEEIMSIYSDFKNECLLCIDDFDKFDKNTGIGKKGSSFVGEDWSHINFNVILEKIQDRIIGEPLLLAGNKCLIKFKALN